jgi:hypothetical protein
MISDKDLYGSGDAVVSVGFFYNTLAGSVAQLAGWIRMVVMRRGHPLIICYYMMWTARHEIVQHPPPSGGVSLPLFYVGIYASGLYTKCALYKHPQDARYLSVRPREPVMVCFFHSNRRDPYYFSVHNFS